MVLQSSRALVVNGKDAVRGRYPYFVTLQHYGAGALIAPDIVLSAGHCRYVTLVCLMVFSFYTRLGYSVRVP
jgi:hypothetical protein